MIPPIVDVALVEGRACSTAAGIPFRWWVQGQRGCRESVIRETEGMFVVSAAGNSSSMLTLIYQTHGRHIAILAYAGCDGK
ncbi:MAG: hypothetical protein ACRDRX_06665 [Pseudonocardiaceae bacterium]